MCRAFKWQKWSASHPLNPRFDCELYDRCPAAVVVSGWRVIRARSLARRVLLGWLSAEWVGILTAYSVAIFAFSFLLGDLLVRLGAMTVLFLPLVLAVPIAAVFLVRRAARLPQELVRQARLPIDTVPSIPSSSSVPPSPPEVEWHSVGLLRRMETVFSVRQHGNISSASRALVDTRPDLPQIATAPDYLRPNETALGVQIPSGDVPIPLASAVSPMAPVRPTGPANPSASTDPASKPGG